MPKVFVKSLRDLVEKEEVTVFTDAINESADYIDELQSKIARLESVVSGLESSLKMYKEESDMRERSTHIEDWVYEYGVNDKEEVGCLLTVHGIEHTIGINEKVVKDLVHIFQMEKLRINRKRKEDAQ